MNGPSCVVKGARGGGRSRIQARKRHSLTNYGIERGVQEKSSNAVLLRGDRVGMDDRTINYNPVRARTFVSDVPSGIFCTPMYPDSCMVNRMTPPPATSEWPFAPSSDDPAKLPGTALAAAESLPLPSNHEDALTIPCDARLVDQSGRQLGTRALRTRARILEATVSILEEKSMRDLRVIDIARLIGSSPATF